MSKEVKKEIEYVKYPSEEDLSQNVNEENLSEEILSESVGEENLSVEAVSEESLSESVHEEDVSTDSLSDSLPPIKRVSMFHPLVKRTENSLLTQTLVNMSASMERPQTSGENTQKSKDLNQEYSRLPANLTLRQKKVDGHRTTHYHNGSAIIRSRGDSWTGNLVKEKGQATTCEKS